MQTTKSPKAGERTRKQLKAIPSMSHILVVMPLSREELEYLKDQAQLRRDRAQISMTLAALKEWEAR